MIKCTIAIDNNGHLDIRMCRTHTHTLFYLNIRQHQTRAQALCYWYVDASAILDMHHISNTIPDSHTHDTVDR